MNANTPREPVTPDVIRLLEDRGFVTLYDADGNVIEFMQRSLYDKCIADGLSPPGRPVGDL